MRVFVNKGACGAFNGEFEDKWLWEVVGDNDVCDPRAVGFADSEQEAHEQAADFITSDLLNRLSSAI